MTDPIEHAKAYIELVEQSGSPSMRIAPLTNIARALLEAKVEIDLWQKRAEKAERGLHCGAKPGEACKSKGRLSYLEICRGCALVKADATETTKTELLTALERFDDVLRKNDPADLVADNGMTVKDALLVEMAALITKHRMAS